MAEEPYIFLAFANGIDQGYLPKLGQEADVIDEALRPWQQKDCIEVKPLMQATLPQISKLIEQNHHRLAVFHYAGHAGEKKIHLTDGQKNAQGIAGMLGSIAGLKLVVLNGCATQGQVKALLQAKKDLIVIATSVPIQDERALVFAREFYQSLGAGRDIGTAFDKAVHFLQAEPQYQIGAADFQARGIDGLDDWDDETEIPWGLYYDKTKPDLLNWKIPSNPPPRDSLDIPPTHALPLYQCLTRLNYIAHIPQVHSYLRRHNMGIFLIHGQEGFGQTWLSNNRLTALKKMNRIHLPNVIKMGTNVSTVEGVLKHLRRVLRFHDLQFQTTAEAVSGFSRLLADQLRERSVLIRLLEVNQYVKSGFLQSFIQEFWQPLCLALENLKAAAEGQNYEKLILLLIEEKESVPQPEEDHPHLLTKVPDRFFPDKVLWLPDIPLVDDVEFLRWLNEDETNGEGILADHFEEHLLDSAKRKDFLGSEAGMPPQLFMEKVCETFGHFIDPNEKDQWEIS